MKFIINILLVYAALSVDFSIELIAQYKAYWNFLDSDNGLSQNRVLDILHSGDGYLYIATIDGLNKYDGFNVERVNIFKDDSTYLTDNVIETIYEDGAGNIWLGTGKGMICRKSGESNRFYLFGNDELGDATGRNNIVQFCETNDGEIWFITDTRLFSISDSGTIIKKQIMPDNKSDFRFVNILSDRSGNIYLFLEDNRIYKFNPADKSLENFSYLLTEAPGSLLRHAVSDYSNNFIVVTDNNFYKINVSARTSLKKKHDLKEVLRIDAEDSNTIWAGTSNFGVYKFDSWFDGNARVTDITVKLKNRENLASIIAFEYLQEGVIFIGTNGNGLSKIDLNTAGFGLMKNSPNNPKSLFNKSIRAILPLNANDILVGGYKGLERIDLSSETSTVLIERKERINNFSIYSMFRNPDSPEVIWIGTEGAGLKKYNLVTGIVSTVYRFNHFFDDWITSVISTDKFLLLGTGNGIKLLDLKSEKLVHPDSQAEELTSGLQITCLTIDKSDRIWCGTKGNGLFIFDKSLKLINRSETKVTDERIFPNDIKSILHTGSDTWLGTNGRGLYKTNSNLEIKANYTTFENLPNNTVYGLAEGIDGELWMSTNKGLSNFSPAKNIFRNYTVQNNLQSNEFNTNAYAQLNNEVILFGGVNGINFFHPDNMNPVKVKERVRFTRITSLLRNYEFTSVVPQDIHFDYSDKEVKIEFIYPVFLQEVVKEFKYKLEGWNNEWKNLRGTRSLTFQNLEPGEYTLKIYPVEYAGTTEEATTELDFYIVPPFYRSTWFISFAVFLFILAGPAIFIYRTRKLKAERNLAESFAQKLIAAQENERKNIAYTLHDNIAQQTLSLKMMISSIRRAKKSEDKFNSLVTEASDIAGNILNDVRNISHNIHPHILDKLGLVKSIESNVRQIGLSSNIEFEVKMADYEKDFDKNEELSIYRIIQELINNVNKHSKAKKCVISYINNAAEFYFEVADDGIGFDKEIVGRGEHNLGFYGIRERTMLLGGNIYVDSEPGKGTAIRLIFRRK